MKVQELMYMILAFNGLMLALTGLGIFQIPNLGFQNYAGNFLIAEILGIIAASLIGASVSTFFVRNATTERTAWYVVAAPTLVAFFNTGMTPFDALSASDSTGVSTAIFGVVKMLIGAVLFWWIFQMIFGGGENYK